MRKIKIFDTTLRDGEQSPGMSMNLKEKIEMAKQLEKLGVDIIEAGFAISSDGDFTSVKTIAETVVNAEVASLARASEKDIDTAWQAVKGANNPRIHLFLATSPLHMKYKLELSEDEVLQKAIAMTKYAKKYTNNVQFSAEDATRSELDFLARVVEGAIKAGATTINLPDTVGYFLPEEYFEFITKLREKVDILNNVTISAHCHDDLGLGVANSLAGIRAGAGQVECTINGIGERAGNAAMEEIVMGLYTRSEYYQASTGVNTKEIVRSSSLLSRITGVKVQPNKAIVGENAFAHESGIHQHGVLKNASTYEIMTPESVGLTENNLVLGKHSGKHAFRDRVESLGFSVSDDELAIAFEKFKSLADKKKKVYDKDIEAIIAKEAVQVPKIYQLLSFVINSGNTITSTAVIKMKKSDKELEKIAIGDGPINAAFKAIDKLVGQKLELYDFKLGAVTEGEDALGDASVVVKAESGKLYSGRGLSTDVIEASIMAYVNAINKLHYQEDQEEK
jgi:2-isopropylmalate synthase